MMGLLGDYDGLLQSGAMDPDHYRCAVRQLVHFHHGQEAASRADRLLAVITLAGRGSRLLPLLARVVCAWPLEHPEPVTFNSEGVPGWVRRALAESASFAGLFEPPVVAAPPAGRWLRDDQDGSWRFVPASTRAVLFYRERSSQDWEPYTPKKGNNAGRPMEKNVRTGAIRPAGGGGGGRDDGAGPGQHRADKPRTLEASRAKSRRDNQRDNSASGPRDGGKGRPAESPRQTEQREKLDMKNLALALHDIFGGLAKRVREMGAAGWDRLSKQNQKSPEIKELAKQVGHRPGRLHGLPGQALEAIADPKRQPANAHHPLAKRGDVPDLSRAENPHPARKYPPPPPLPIPEAARGGLPPHGSRSQRSEAQQKGLPASPSAKASRAIEEISGTFAKRIHEPKIRAAIAKAVEGMTHAEALHVYRTLIPHKEQGAMPVPRSSREAADALVRGLAATQPRQDIGARIARDRSAYACAGSMTASLGEKHAELEREEKSNRSAVSDLLHKLGGSLGSLLGGGARDKEDGKKSIPEEESEVGRLLRQRLGTNATRKDVSGAGRKMLEASLKDSGTPVQINHKEVQDVGPKSRKAIAEGVAWVQGLLKNAPPLELRFGVARDGRATATDMNYAAGGIAYTTIKVKEDNGKKGSRGEAVHTVIHEIGHAIESQVPGASEAAREFLKHRVGNEKPRDMGEISGMHGELGRKNNFDKHFDEASAHYVGKVYDTGETEIISMGLEQMYKDPVGFAKKDPEYFALIHGILSGNLRGKGGKKA